MLLMMTAMGCREAHSCNLPRQLLQATSSRCLPVRPAMVLLPPSPLTAAVHRKRKATMAMTPAIVAVSHASMIRWRKWRALPVVPVTAMAAIRPTAAAAAAATAFKRTLIAAMPHGGRRALSLVAIGKKTPWPAGAAVIPAMTAWKGSESMPLPAGCVWSVCLLVICLGCIPLCHNDGCVKCIAPRCQGSAQTPMFPCQPPGTALCRYVHRQRNKRTKTIENCLASCSRCSLQIRRNNKRCCVYWGGGGFRNCVPR